ncbi:MAG: tetratricopeptide repeat protein [Desulfomonilaceae bacterium]
MAATPRNAPCPCGSGKKFKNCCLLKNSGYADTPDKRSTLSERAVSAYKAMSEKKWDEAIYQFKECIDEDPSSFEILQALAGCYDGAEDYLMAAEFHEKSLARSNEAMKPVILYRLGVSQACAGRIQKAHETFETAMELFKTPKEKETIANILSELSQIMAGTKPTQAFLIQAQLQRAFSAFEDEDYEQAAARLDKISRLDPQNPAIFYNLGVAYTFLKRQQAAIECFERTVQLDPEYVMAYYNMGQIYLLVERDYSRALNCFDRAITFRDDYIGAYHQKGIAYEMLGDTEKALECWRKAVELDPGNKQAKDNIDRVQKKLGQT